MNTILKTISYKNLSNWSVVHLLANDFNYNKEFPLVRIGDFLTRNKTRIEIEDETIYKRVTIRLYNKGVKLRNTEIGKNIGTKKQFLIKKGHFLLSKIDARNGAFGIATDEIDGAIITADFFAYDIDKSKIDPIFLVLITTTEQFQKFAQSASSGTTGRQRIDETKFLNVKIPLPTITEQIKIVHSYNEKIKKIKKIEEDITLNEKKSLDTVFESLGMVQKKIISTKNNLLQFTRFKDLKNKWSGFKDDFSILSNKYELVQLQDLAEIGSGGTPSRSNSHYYKNGTISWIKTGEVRDEIIYETSEKITQKALNNSSAKIYPVNSLIVAMYGATAGRTAKMGITAATNQACAVLYNIDTNLIEIDFLWFYLFSQFDNFQLISEGSAQPNLNVGKIRSYPIPLPPLETQIKIVNKINELKRHLKELKCNAKKYKTLAVSEFEKKIFNEIN